MLKFQHKVALITGSGTGIGKAIAKKFVENGASVIILGRRREPLEETSKMLEEIISEKNTSASVRIFSGVDVSEEAGINDMFESLKNDKVTVDYIVNNAGVSGPVTCFANAPLDEFKSTIGIHLTGTFWGSVQALKVMKEGGKIITISTFFTEERPLEQRPYRFRSPYTASQGAKNRLAEAMSWELIDKGIISIATNPGPVHSDRIYKTVYPKAASEFMRISGFEDLVPIEVDAASKELLPLLGEDEKVVKEGIVKAAEKLANGKDVSKLTETFTNLLNKIQTIAEKIQNNTSHMIANQEFLTQGQVAESVLNLCDDKIAKILNGKVVPGDRVFYPVRPHIGTTTPGVHQPDFGGKVIVFTIDATDKADAERVEFLAQHVEKNGGRAACFISQSTPTELQEYISDKCHSHIMDIKNPEEVEKWLNTAKTNHGEILAVVHVTGKLPEISKLTELSRAKWEALTEKFISTPATVAQRALEQFVPGGDKDPRLYKDAKGAIMIIGPDLPIGRKVTGTQRAQVEVFRGALRPFTTTVNQELSDVLKSKIRMFTIFPGTVTGADPSNQRIAEAINFLVSDSAASSAEVIFCVDELR
ncbi:SDR family oxidoreductase [Marine Group I thaumarchaeote]|mgnify:FL=1|jgi:NAD(P)-dependent dehydrogenase (short-subunit alcohol dehydrogenase family)|uniref:SDR family oxidoreductase n=2 Tax=Marine Group I thaumarchaeote TaxID=2511932 RepID=A0A7K4M7S4_9ARCH|nr:SDR family oxidoreductase [Candidatus Nitrosopumilus sp. MTA1]NWJ20106.1 SDR family oxidoreductase [Marine Group I thaumarchaeote]NWJ57017.1 SDR family oxidoreductase [Marine Group I thaumarchaeote]NWK01190.1 SDR family oxidoreductase [Marine Group I thaumarchaeote]NWK07817.1 SDR family oxidoreductase [Marine Group I thaumarchaeote]